VVDALQSGDVRDHVEELGDLLLQIVFQAELRHAEGAFGIDDVVSGIVAKLVRRHPHVFGEAQAKTSQAVLVNWAKLKAVEKAKKDARARSMEFRVARRLWCAPRALARRRRGGF